MKNKLKAIQVPVLTWSKLKVLSVKYDTTIYNVINMLLGGKIK